MDWLESLDRNFFLLLNGYHHPWFDVFFKYVGLVLTWIPLYLLFFILLVRRFKKKVWITLLTAIMLVIATDQTSVFLKNSFQRYRPSHNLELKGSVHLIDNESGGQFGFVSSHAANMWGIAVFIAMALGPVNRVLLVLLMSWATLVSYGRIYAGVHYPADVLGGAALGIFFGYGFYFIHTRILQKFPIEIQSENPS